MSTINRPIQFQGTPERATANYLSHYWDHESGRCDRCDSKPWHAAAHYPCGEEPPRETITVSGEPTMADLFPRGVGR